MNPQTRATARALAEASLAGNPPQRERLLAQHLAAALREIARLEAERAQWSAAKIDKRVRRAGRAGAKATPRAWHHREGS